MKRGQIGTMKSKGRLGYEAYAFATGGKTFDGRDMPLWTSLPPHITKAWEAAANAIAESVRPNTADLTQ